MSLVGSVKIFSNLVIHRTHTVLIKSDNHNSLFFCGGDSLSVIQKIVRTVDFVAVSIFQKPFTKISFFVD